MSRGPLNDQQVREKIDLWLRENGHQGPIVHSTAEVVYFTAEQTQGATIGKGREQYIDNLFEPNAAFVYFPDTNEVIRQEGGLKRQEPSHADEKP